MMKSNVAVFPALLTQRRAIQCPKCHVGMALTTVTGISVEKCPLCEGVFFDKGEVEALVRRNLRAERFRFRRLFRWL